MCQGSLAGRVTAVVGVADVCSDYVSGDVADRSKELTRTPKMPFTEMVAQPRMLPEETEGASAFEQLKRLGNAHSRLQVHKHMHVVGFDLQLKNLHPIFLSDFPQETLAVLAERRKLKGVLRILGLPHEMECILPYSMAMSYQTFHFSPSAQKFHIAHANPIVRSGCANYAAHPLLRTSVENREVTSKDSERNRVRNSSAA